MSSRMPDLYDAFMIFDDKEDDEGVGKKRDARVFTVPANAQAELGFPVAEDEVVEVSFKKADLIPFYRNGKSFLGEKPEKIKDKVKKKV